MSSNPRDSVTLGAQIGGQDAYDATNDCILAFRRLLRQKCEGPYGDTVEEFALVLRIDGSVEAWGKSGLGNAALLRKKTVATVDIFMPTSSWMGRDTADVRNALAVAVTDAIEALVELATKKKINVDAERIRADVDAARREFLA